MDDSRLNKELRIPRLILATTVLVTALALGGCIGDGRQLRFLPWRMGTPSVARIAESLGANDAQIENLRVKAACHIMMPDLEQRLSVRIEFRRPDRLRVGGWKFPLPKKVIALRCVGDSFIYEDYWSDQTYEASERIEFASLPSPMSPSDFLDEILFPVDWNSLDPGNVRTVEFDRRSGVVTLLVNESRGTLRRVKVQGPPWVVVRTELLDGDGRTVAETDLSDYREVKGVRIPGRIEAQLPDENTALTLAVTGIDLNPELDDDRFVVTPEKRH